MDPETRAWIQERQDRLARLRARARRLRLTIKSSRGTAYGYYHLQAGNNYDFHPIVCDGETALEGWIRDLEQEVQNDPQPPSVARMQEAHQAVEARRYETARAQYEATRSKVCEFCGGPEEGPDTAYRVGSEEDTLWVHRRCYEPFCERNRRALEAQGFVNGVRTVRS